MRKTKERIISGVLCFLMVFSNILPVFTTIINADVTSNILEGSVEYTDSGQIVENPETGTDLDNFEVSLSFGTIGNNITGDTLTITDQSIYIDTVLTVTYTGEQIYKAGDLSFTYDYPVGANRKDPTAALLHDVGAELVGSGSGRGDWYYTRDTDAHRLTFTNKADTTGAFSSSIEIVSALPPLRDIINGWSDTITATFSVNGIEHTLNMRDLYIKAFTTHDEYSIDAIHCEHSFYYKSYGSEDNIGSYQGYDLNKYFITEIDLEETYNLYNRGSTYTRTLTLPEGCYFVSTDSNVWTETQSLIVKPPNTAGSAPQFYDDFDSPSGICIAIPYDLYKPNDTITIKWDANAVFYDTNETWSDSMETNIVLKGMDIDYVPGVINLYKDSNDELYIYKIGTTGKDFEWKLDYAINTAFQNTQSEDYLPTKTVIEDYNTFIANDLGYSQPKVRDLENNEYYYNYVTIAKNIYSEDEYPNCNIKVYAKPNDSTEYVLIEEVDPSKITLPYKVILNNSDVFYNDIKIEIDNDSYMYVEGYGYQVAYEFYLGAHIEFEVPEEEYDAYIDKYALVNYANVAQTLKNGLIYNDIAYHILDFKEAIANITSYNSYYAPTYSIENNKFKYTPFAHTLYRFQIDPEDIDNIKTNTITASLTIPSYLDFNEDKIRIGLGNNICKESDGSIVFDGPSSDWYIYDVDYVYVDSSSYNKFYDSYIDVSSVITESNHEKTITVTLTTKEGYYFSPSYNTRTSNAVESLKLGIDVYMDFDTYSGLLAMGKLPTSFTVIGTREYDPNILNGLIRWSRETLDVNQVLSLPSVAGSTYEGINKLVDTGNGFTTDLSKTVAGGNYSYKLRLAGGQAKVDSIILYDNLEEAYGENEYWKGTFTGLDTTLLDMYFKGENYTYTIYYSADKNQAFDLSASGWIKAEDWTKELSEVKSIAVDLGDLVLPSKVPVYVIVNMKAPTTANSGIKAYNSFAADYKAYDNATNILMEDIKALPSNITEVIYNVYFDYTVNKEWVGNMSEPVNIDFYINDTVSETITLSEDNNWTHTFENLPAFDENSLKINYSVVETSSFKRVEVDYDTVIDSNNNITTTITNTRLPDDGYNIEKEWITEGKSDIILDLIEDIDLTLEEQKTLRANKRLDITASGENLEDITFEVKADANGIITIPIDYADYTDFSVNLGAYNDRIYSCKYSIKYVDPEKPDSIILKTTDTEQRTITLTKENNYSGTYNFIDKAVLFLEEDVEGWETGTKYNGLAITFSSDSASAESSDGFYIYYNYGNRRYRTNKYYTSNFKDLTIEIPVTNFYLYWETNSSVNNAYGFKIINIENKEVASTIGSGDYALPSVTPIELGFGEYPETDHNPYKNSQKILWHYSQDKNPDNITIEKVSDNNYNVKIVNTAKQIASIISSDVSVKEYTYNIEKEWIVNTPSISLGLIETDSLTKSEQKTLRAGKTLSITASGEGLETVSFDIIATSEGIINIPPEYNNYTNFEISISKNDTTYNFKYVVSKSEPIIPDNINIIPSGIGKDKNGNEISEIVLAKENNWKESYSFNSSNISFTETLPEGWIAPEVTNGLAITFDQNFSTESTSYDYLIIYYELNGEIYQFGKYGGDSKSSTSLAGKTINVPSTDVYFYWITDGSVNDYHGFGIENISPVLIDSSNTTKGTLPALTAIELSGEEYPELDERKPYKNNQKILWHYTGENKYLNTEITKIDDSNYNVKITNQGNASYGITGIIDVIKDKEITITKEWNINQDYIKINLKNSLGYDVKYDYIEILNSTGDTVLETINSNQAGLIVSANKYDTDKLYTAKVYLSDGTVYNSSINVNKFETVPVECELYIDNVLAETFTLNTDNNWSYTFKISDSSTYEVKEITTGNWTYKVNDNVITNTVLHEIEITDITVPADGEIIDTGNNGIPLFIYPLFLIGIIGLSTSLKYKKKYKY